MAKILLTNPSHDLPTQLLSSWIDAVAAHVQSLQNDTKVIHLKGKDVNKEGLRSSINLHNPRLLLLNGHGSRDCLYGHNDTPLLNADDASDGHLHQRIIHALACKAAAQLGHDLIAHGASAFIGYKEDFQVVWHKGLRGKQDIIASLYLNPAYEVAHRLAEGKTAQESYNSAQKMYAQSLKEALKNNAGPNILAPLFSNMQHHTLIGDGSAKIA